MTKQVYGYVYMTTNQVNGKKYIGQKTSSSFVENYKGSGTLIQKAIAKYGTENFHTEIIEWCYSQEELDEKERFYIALYDAVESDDFYNLAVGGAFGSARKGSKISDEGRKHISEGHKAENLSDETRKKMSDRMSGSNNPMYGTHREGSLNPFFGKEHDEETKRKISESNKGTNNGMFHKPSPMRGKKHSEETKKKISESCKGKPNVMKGKHLTEEHKRKIRESCKGINVGHKISEETRKKMSESAKKRKATEETKQKLSKVTSGKNNPMYGVHRFGEASPNYGRIKINNGTINKMVKKNELEDYINNGYTKGWLKKITA